MMAEARGFEPRRAFSARLRRSKPTHCRSVMLPCVAPGRGFEPRFATSRATVLPLNEPGSKWCARRDSNPQTSGSEPEAYTSSATRAYWRRVRELNPQPLSRCRFSGPGALASRPTLRTVVASEGIEPPDRLTPQTGLQPAPAPYGTTSPHGPRGWIRTSNIQALDLTPLPVGLRAVEVVDLPGFEPGRGRVLSAVHLPVVLEVRKRMNLRPEVVGLM